MTGVRPSRLMTGRIGFGATKALICTGSSSLSLPDSRNEGGEGERELRAGNVEGANDSGEGCFRTVFPGADSWLRLAPINAVPKD